MEKEKINFTMVLVLVSIVVLFLLFIYVNSRIPDALAKEEDWNEHWICSKEEFFSQEDANKGWGCLLDECVSGTIDKNRISECKCGNETVRKICTEKIFIKKMEWERFKSPLINNTEEEL